MDFLMNTSLFAWMLSHSNFFISYACTIPVRVLIFAVAVLILLVTKLVYHRVKKSKKLQTADVSPEDSSSAQKASRARKVENRVFWIVLAVVAIVVVAIGRPAITKLGAALFQDQKTQVVTEGNFNWMELDAKNHLLYAVGHDADQVLAFHTDDLSAPPEESESLGTLSQSFAFNPSANEIYFPTSSEIIVLDVPALRIKDRIEIPELSPGDVWMVWDKQNDQLILSSEADVNSANSFLVIDRASGKVVSDEPLNAWNIYLHPNQPILYLGPRFHEYEYYLYDTVAHKIIQTFKTGELGDRMILDENRNELLISNPSKGTISRYDPLTFEYLGAISANWGVRSLAIDKEHNLLFAGSLVDNTLVIIDQTTNQTIRRCWVGPWVRSIVLDTENRLAYVSTRYELLCVQY